MGLVDGDVFDSDKVEELRLLVGGNTAFLKRIQDVYLVQFDQKFPELCEAIANGDDRTVRALAHLLKGASYTVALYRVAAAFDDIEERSTAVETGEDFGDERALITRQIAYFNENWIRLFTGETSKVDLS